MKHHLLMAGLSLAVALAVGSLVSEPTVNRSPAIVMVDSEDQSCGPEPEYRDNPSVDLTAEWYSYGDCSGWYGPIDAVGSIIPDMELADE